MGNRTTHTGYLRQRGATSSSSSRSNGPSAGVVPSIVHFQIAADFGLDAGILSGVILPTGATVLRVDFNVLSLAGHTTPAIDIGIEGSTPDDNALVSAFDISSSGSVNMETATSGLEMGQVITEDSEITYTDMSSTQATAGTIDIYIWYTFADDGKLNN